MEDYQGTHTGQQIDSAVDKINALNPATAGVYGQVLTRGENGTTFWNTPEVGGLEVIVIKLVTEDGLGTVSGVQVSVQVEGENQPRVLTTSAQGTCSLHVSQGLQYTVTFGTIQGYLPVSNVTYRASLPSREITALYKVDETTNMEHVYVDLIYNGTGTARAATLNVVVNGTTNSYPFVGNRCEFDVALNSAYRIEFVAVDGYVKPVNQNFTATLRARHTKAYYVGAVSGLAWVKLDGTMIDFEEVVSGDKDSLLGLRIAPSNIASANSQFVVPLAYLLGESVIGTKAWGPQVEFTSIGCYPNQTAALTDDGSNFDGENNTDAVLEEATSRSLSCPAFTACRSLSFTVAGQTKYGFLGSFAQMKAFSDNRTNINLVCNSVFGKNCIAVNSGSWWTSTQASQTYAVHLSNGGFNYSTKTLNGSVVPFLAY